MRGDGGCGAAGFGATGTAGGALAATTGGTGAGGAGTAGVAAGRTGGAAAGEDSTGAATGLAWTTGETGCAVTGAAGGGGVATIGRLTGGATTGFSSGGCATGACATGGGTGRGATASFFCVIAFSTSPGREMCDRSIFVLISSSPRIARELDLPTGDEPSAAERMYTRTFSASCSSRELECVFFSVTPTSGSVSRIDLLLTSSSRARSLIRTLLIRPFASPCCS